MEPPPQKLFDPARDVIQFRRLVRKSVHFLGLAVGVRVSGATSTRIRLPATICACPSVRLRSI
jgi:hypothetical protein